MLQQAIQNLDLQPRLLIGFGDKGSRVLSQISDILELEFGAPPPWYELISIEERKSGDFGHISSQVSQAIARVQKPENQPTYWFKNRRSPYSTIQHSNKFSSAEVIVFGSSSEKYFSKHIANFLGKLIEIDLGHSNVCLLLEIPVKQSTEGSLKNYKNVIENLNKFYAEATKWAISKSRSAQGFRIGQLQPIECVCTELRDRMQLALMILYKLFTIESGDSQTLSEVSYRGPTSWNLAINSFQISRYPLPELIQFAKPAYLEWLLEVNSELDANAPSIDDYVETCFRQIQESVLKIRNKVKTLNGLDLVDKPEVGNINPKKLGSFGIESINTILPKNQRLSFYEKFLVQLKEQLEELQRKQNTIKGGETKAKREIEKPSLWVLLLWQQKRFLQEEKRLYSTSEQEVTTREQDNAALEIIRAYYDELVNDTEQSIEHLINQAYKYENEKTRVGRELSKYIPELNKINFGLTASDDVISKRINILERWKVECSNNIRMSEGLEIELGLRGPFYPQLNINEIPEKLSLSIIEAALKYFRNDRTEISVSYENEFRHNLQEVKHIYNSTNAISTMVTFLPQYDSHFQSNFISKTVNLKRGGRSVLPHWIFLRNQVYGVTLDQFDTDI
jgi:hypothetical protein